MNKEYKYIVVLGSGYSGASAIRDYLSGRYDISSPLDESEFELIHDSHGIADLDNALNYMFSVNGASYALDKFEEFSKNYSINIPYNNRKQYLTDIENYINNITQLKYKGLPKSRLEEFGFFYKNMELLCRKLYFKLGRKYVSGFMRIPVNKDVFHMETVKLIDSIFNNTSSNSNKIIVDQGGSFWNPLTSTKYYSSRKVIVVTRDPRDIYSDLKSQGYAYPGGDPMVFCMWYKEIMSRISIEEWKNKCVVHIKFENFVLDFENSRKKICEFLDLNNSIKSTYKVEKSKINVGKFRNNLSSNELRVIKSELSQYFN